MSLDSLKNMMIHRQQSGFSLIEVLVTMLIMAVGLMGIAAMQYRSLRYSNDALIRSQANFLAYDIADRIRVANIVGPNIAAGYQGNHVTNHVDASDPAGCKLLSNQSFGMQTVSDIRDDLTCWRRQASLVLPPGSNANISLANGIYTVTLSWADRDTGAIANVVNYSFVP